MAAPFSRARRVEAHGTPLQAVHKSPRARYRGRCCARIGRIWDVQFKRSASRAAAAQEPKYTIIRPRGRWSWGPSPSPSPATPPDSPAVYITRPSPPPPWRDMACGAVQELASCRSWFVLIDHHMYHDVQLYGCLYTCNACTSSRRKRFAMASPKGGVRSRCRCREDGRLARSGAAAAAAERPIDSGSSETPP